MWLRLPCSDDDGVCGDGDDGPAAVNLYLQCRFYTASFFSPLISYPSIIDKMITISNEIEVNSRYAWNQDGFKLSWFFYCTSIVYTFMQYI